MRKNNLWITALAFGLSLSAYGQEGGISSGMLQEIKQAYKGTPADKAIHNAIAGNDINKLAVNNDSKNNFDTYFSNKVNSKGITNQKSSGRCWLFTGLNVIRAQVIAKYNLPEFELSQNYNFFWDQLEKANLFLQGIIDTREKPIDDKMVEWLFKNPIGDGGQFTGISDNLMKYGIVPSGVMVETYSSDNTSRMLVLNLGEPPTKFTWTRKDASGKPVETKEYTPQSFYQEFVGEDLKNNYVMLMNDPSRDFYKLYEIDFDRHAYDGKNWTYVNLPIEDIKEMAIASIKDSTMMYFSCDVGKFFDRNRGVLDVNYYDYGSLMGTTFGMDKKQRIQTFASGSSHAMTLMAVDLDANGQPKKWMVENSWGPGANNGHLIMTDEWFNEYMFRLVVNKKYITDKVREVLKQTPTRLPAWDPMFAEEE